MGSTGRTGFTVSCHPCFAGRVELRRGGHPAYSLLHISTFVYIAFSLTAGLQPVRVDDRPDPFLQPLSL